MRPHASMYEGFGLWLGVLKCMSKIQGLAHLNGYVQGLFYTKGLALVPQCHCKLGQILAQYKVHGKVWGPFGCSKVINPNNVFMLEVDKR